MITRRQLAQNKTKVSTAEDIDKIWEDKIYKAINKIWLLRLVTIFNDKITMIKKYIYTQDVQILQLII